MLVDPHGAPPQSIQAESATRAYSELNLQVQAPPSRWGANALPAAGTTLLTPGNLVHSGHLSLAGAPENKRSTQHRPPGGARQPAETAAVLIRALFSDSGWRSASGWSWSSRLGAPGQHDASPVADGTSGCWEGYRLSPRDSRCGAGLQRGRGKCNREPAGRAPCLAGLSRAAQADLENTVPSGVG